MYEDSNISIVDDQVIVQDSEVDSDCQERLCKKGCCNHKLANRELSKEKKKYIVEGIEIRNR